MADTSGGRTDKLEMKHCHHVSKMEKPEDWYEWNVKVAAVCGSVDVFIGDMLKKVAEHTHIPLVDEVNQLFGPGADEALIDKGRKTSAELYSVLLIMCDKDAHVVVRSIESGLGLSLIHI